MLVQFTLFCSVQNRNLPLVTCDDIYNRLQNNLFHNCEEINTFFDLLPICHSQFFIFVTFEQFSVVFIKLTTGRWEHGSRTQVYNNLLRSHPA